MSVTPVVVLLGDHTLARSRWTIQQETARLDEERRTNPEFDRLCNKNGWPTEALAWGHVIHGLMELAEFDDENGRVE